MVLIGSKGVLYPEDGRITIRKRGTNNVRYVLAVENTWWQCPLPRTSRRLASILLPGRMNNLTVRRLRALWLQGS
jgi:hypothetical protein